MAARPNTRLMFYTTHGEYLTSVLGISIALPLFASPPCSGLSADEPFPSFHSPSFPPSSLVLNSVVADPSLAHLPLTTLFGGFGAAPGDGRGGLLQPSAIYEGFVDSPDLAWNPKSRIGGVVL